MSTYQPTFRDQRIGPHGPTIGDRFHRSLMRVALPERFRLFKAVQESTTWDRERITRYQEAELRKIIGYCWEYVPFYRNHWRGHLDDPRDVQSVADLQHLPLVTRQQFREHARELITTDASVKQVAARTGGSTASPIVYRTTRFDDEYLAAQLYSGWTWAGWQVGEPYLVVGGQSIGVGLRDKRTWKDWIVHRWVTSGSNITLDRTREVVRLPMFKKITLIYGYPNSIRELCERMVELGARPPKLRGVVCTAEVMLPEVRARISELLGGVPVLDQWGLNDGALHGCESAERQGLHVSFHRAILEVVDEDNRQIWDLKRTGNGLATSLMNLATPFVRYETGDRIHWHSFDPAPTGVTWPRIGPIDGRTGDVIHLSSGRSIPMPGLTLVMRWLEGLRHYQFVQTGPDDVVVRLDREDGYKLSEDETIEFLRQHIAADVTWRIVWGTPELTRSGKMLVIRNDWLRSQGLTRPKADATP